MLFFNSGLFHGITHLTNLTGYDEKVVDEKKNPRNASYCVVMYGVDILDKIS